MAERVARIILTGASSGIGAALARELARPGASLLLIARDPARLAAVAEEVRARGAKAETAALSVTDREGLAELLRESDARVPTDLIIANAGVAGGLSEGRRPEAEGLSHWLVDVNLKGMLNSVEPLLPAMIARGRGRIALVSSIAGIRPVPDLPSYSAAKAGVRAYGIALRGWLRPHGIGVTVICPGFVTSPMSARHLGPKPFEMSAEAAARLIARGIARGGSAITFPWQLALLVWLGNRLPPRLSDWFERRFAARILPDPRAGER
ncbi:MAG TPA: SDR family NAD(P)-dependent oxidoreductase [Paracoccaceae bacterium]|nr:SDR family NAD(P)-dependent oxidoreductase [Paracoccaceae bacterium]